MKFDIFDFILILFLIMTVFIIFYFIKSFRKSFHKKNKKIRFVLFNKRVQRVKNFENLSERILLDILEALKNGENSHEQAIALLPLLLDIRKIGEQLIRQQNFFHTFLFPMLENRLKPRLERLIHVEKLLKSLPRKGSSCENLQNELS